MSTSKITVVDYGSGNLLSVKRGLEYCGAKVLLSSSPEEILASKKVVLPGVGAFANAMKSLERLSLDSTLRTIAKRNIPLLGICLGMQLLLDSSDEFGSSIGLGLIPGRVIAIPSQNIFGENQKIPHIGWASILPSNPVNGWEHTLLKNNKSGDSAYFVHSYMAVPKLENHNIAKCYYGGHNIAAMIGRDNIVGCQFHPEKSGEVGLKILRNFVMV